jgi:hypothetical protein
MNANVTARIAVSENEGPGDLHPAIGNFTEQLLTRFTSGTDPGQVNRAFVDRRSIASGLDETLDLVAGNVDDQYGQTISFAKVKAILFSCVSGSIKVEPGTDPFLGPLNADAEITLAAGQYLLLVHPGDGWAVTADTADEIDVTEITGTGASVYDVILLGVGTV